VSTLSSADVNLRYGKALGSEEGKGIKSGLRCEQRKEAEQGPAA
jgi:hypothetical protein